MSNLDEFAKSHEIPFSVIPAKAGIQSFQEVVEHLDSSRTRSGIYRSDDFLRIHQCWMLIFFSKPSTFLPVQK